MTKQWTTYFQFALGLGFAAAIASSGCTKPDDLDKEAADSANTLQQSEAAQAVPADIREVMTIWSAGDQDAAIASLVALFNVKPDAERYRPYTETEAEFIARPTEEREALKMEIVEDLSTLRSIARELSRRSNVASEAGDTTAAESYLQIVKQVGQANTGPDMMLIVQLVGDAMIQRADHELADLQN